MVSAKYSTVCNPYLIFEIIIAIRKWSISLRNLHEYVSFYYVMEVLRMRKRITIQEKFELIMECRNSGLSDYQWCKQRGLSPKNIKTTQVKVEPLSEEERICPECGELMVPIGTGFPSPWSKDRQRHNLRTIQQTAVYRNQRISVTPAKSQHKKSFFEFHASMVKDL